MAGGWESTDNTGSTYRATYKLKRTYTIGSGARERQITKDQDVRVITNARTGNYDVYLTEFGTGDKPVYSYNASTDAVSVKNESLYGEVFAGNNSAQLNNVNFSTRKATVDIASSVASRDERFKLENLPGYKRFGRFAPAPPAGANPEGGGPTPDPDETTPVADSGAEPTSTGDNPDSTGFTVDANDSVNIENSGDIDYGTSVFRYPTSSEKYNGDYIKIRCFDYQKSGFNALESEPDTFKITRMKDRIDKDGDSKGVVILPIQSGITEVKSTAWGDGGLNPITAQFGNLAYGTISRGADPGAALGYFMRGSSEIMKKAANSTDDMKKLVTNYFVQQALGGTVPGLLSRTAGAAVNNNVELLFTGANLRSFSFNFTLTPRDKTESEQIRKIVRFFKREMTPRLSKSGFFLLAPRVFSIDYIHTKNGENKHPFLNKIGICALRDFSVDYTPGGNYMTYAENGSMTQYTINMSFGEIDPIYASDYDEDGDDQFNPTSMGY